MLNFDGKMRENDVRDGPEEMIGRRKVDGRGVRQVMWRWV